MESIVERNDGQEQEQREATGDQNDVTDVTEVQWVSADWFYSPPELS